MIGKIIGGRYQIIELIGVGGIAEVYLANNIILKQPVAIKIFHPFISQEMAFKERFVVESSIAAKLAHPHIVKVHQVGIENGSYYLVMEYIEGVPLRQVSQQRNLTPYECASIGIQICDALNYAHQCNIVHQDIKTHNILYTADEKCKLGDFGIPRRITEPTASGQNVIINLPYYISPEQTQELPVSPASDIYSLGIVLYELATGTLPFDGDSIAEIAQKHIQQPVPDPRKINPYLPSDLIDIIYTALQKQPNRRFSSALYMKQALQKALTRFPKGVQYSMNTRRDDTDRIPIQTETSPNDYQSNLSALQKDQEQKIKRLQSEEMEEEEGEGKSSGLFFWFILLVILGGLGYYILQLL
ncbi:serine/threonine protein kinase [Thermoflavimicrobium daqui]|nr:serine/threonine-protein kinase [Thermoflavimicrobium daqui]